MGEFKIYIIKNYDSNCIAIRMADERWFPNEREIQSAIILVGKQANIMWKHRGQSYWS